MGKIGKIILSFPVTVVDATATEVDDSVINEAMKESRWRLGTAIINGMERKVERRKQLDDYAYRMGEHLLDPDCVTHWKADEYMDWRDL